MAGSAFKSATKRSPAGAEDDGILRRSRSLSRCSGRFSPADSGELRDPPSGRFVNTVRGSGFPEVSLDDLANELFPEKDDAQSDRRFSDFHSRMETESSRRRGRSVSRKENFGGESGRKGVADSSSRRRRSVSIARYRGSDSESYSSAVTDDEGRGSCTSKSTSEKIIRADYAQKRAEHPVGDGERTGLYKAMREEVRNVIKDIRIELQKVMADPKPSKINNAGNLQSKVSDTAQAIAEMRRSYNTKLEESEKRKQELLAQLAAEEERRRELTKIVRDLLPEPKRSVVSEKSSHVRRKSNDKTSVSKQLNEEAEKYFEDFISNVEDTDFSSFDGDRSDTSSTMGGSTKSKVPATSSAVSERQGSLYKHVSLPAETDGIVLPWLQWETSYCSSSPNSKIKNEMPGLHLLAGEQAATLTFADDNYARSGYWSSITVSDNGSSSASRGNTGGDRFGEPGCCLQVDLPTKSNGSSFNMDEYMHLQNMDDLLIERLKQRHRIDLGSLILCGRSFI